MVAYSFKERFIGPIRAGLEGDGVSAYYVGSILHNPKRQTIRAHRRGRGRHARPGDELQLYTAMRTKYCRLIGKARCVSVDPIKIDFDYFYHPSYVEAGRIEIGDPFRVCQGKENLNRFAAADGFADWNEMRQFWQREHGLGKFEGVIIRWEPLA